MSWPIGGIIAAVVGLAAAALSGAWWLWWRLPKRQVNRLRFAIRDPKARADVEDNFRKTIGQLLGGAAVLIGAALAYLQFTQQQQASQRQFIQQQQASRDLFISNQVAKGFEQLSSDKLVVRLGGIYALDGVLSASEQYYQPIVETLSAFVRDGTRADSSRSDQLPATDIQAALTVVVKQAIPSLFLWVLPDLRSTHIPLSNLQYAHLNGAILAGADLHGAILAFADLHLAILDDADLRGAHLAFADLHRAILGGADLSGADLSGADLRDAINRLAVKT